VIFGRRSAGFAVRRRSARRRATSAAALGAAFLAAAASVSAQSFEQPEQVLVATSGSDSELVSTIEIGTVPGERATVVMSLPLEAFGLAPGDRLVGSSEAEVTTDCQVEAPRCVGNAYTYNPTVQSQLILASDPALAGGTGTTPLSRLSSRVCTHVRHHCVPVFPRAVLDVSPDAPPACVLAGGCHLNLVVSAHNPAAKPGDMLIIGEDEPDGTTIQDKGRVNAVRLRPDSPGPAPDEPVSRFVSREPAVESIPVRNKLAEGKAVVFSQPLDDLRRDDQLAVSARMSTDMAHLRENDRILVNSTLILARRPDSTSPGRLVKRVAEEKGELTEANGFNCTPASTPCLTRKVGVMSLVRSARKRSGSRVPLYVNLVVGSTAAGGRVPPGATLEVEGGALRVVHYPASRRG
jgi:hypothetical protein